MIKHLTLIAAAMALSVGAANAHTVKSHSGYKGHSHGIVKVHKRTVRKYAPRRRYFAPRRKILRPYVQLRKRLFIGKRKHFHRAPVKKRTFKRRSRRH